MSTRVVSGEQGTDRTGPLAANPARELLAILARHVWTALTVFALVAGIAVVVVLVTPPVYEAQTTLIVRIGREYVYRPEVGGTEAARNPSLSEIVNSEVEILSSPDLAGQVVRELGVDTLYPELPELEPDPEVAAKKAVVRFRKAATVRPVLESSVIKVAFENPAPQVAADAVNLLVERFADKHVEVFGEERTHRLEEELAARNAELIRAEDALTDFRRMNRVSDLSEQRVLMLGQRARLEDGLGASEVQLEELRQRLEGTALEDSLEAPVLAPYLQPEMKGELLRQLHELGRELRALDPPPAVRLLEEAALRLLDLGLREQQLLQQYSEENRQVQGVRSEIESVKAFLRAAEQRAGELDQVRLAERQASAIALQREIARRTTEIELLVREEARRALELDRQQLRALALQHEDYERRLTDLDREIARLDHQEGALRRLERDLVAAESAVHAYREKVDQARIAEDLDREKQINVRVIARATAPVEPIGLSPKLEIGLGILVGLLAGAGVAVLLDLLRGH